MPELETKEKGILIDGGGKLKGKAFAPLIWEMKPRRPWAICSPVDASMEALD